MSPEPNRAAELRAAASRLPQVGLGHWPTPLDELRRLSEELGVRLLMKRDDCTGFYLGGNKTRHNEFLIGDAISQGCDTVVWGAEVQSNNCRQTAAACAKYGLDCHLFLSPGRHRRDVQGNLLLDHLVGARVEIVDAQIGPELDTLLRERGQQMRERGRSPFFWDRPRVVPLAAVSYALCLAEILEQCAARGVVPDAVYVSSSGSTAAGLLLGQAVLDYPGVIRAVCPIVWPWDIAQDLANTATQAAILLGLPHVVTAGQVDAPTEWVGDYGRPTREGQLAMRRVLQTEAILLDPIYSAKAMATLIADVESGRIRRGATVIFIHTGGTPVVFAMAEEMLQTLSSGMR